VHWSGSTKGWCNRFRKQCRWFALKYFFGLRIKTLSTLKIFGTTFENRVDIAPISPLASRLNLCKVLPEVTKKLNGLHQCRSDLSSERLFYNIEITRSTVYKWSTAQWRPTERYGVGSGVRSRPTICVMIDWWWDISGYQLTLEFKWFRTGFF